MTGANLAGANLNNSNFTYANLNGANLTGANVSSSTLAGANLTGVAFNNAMLKNSDLTDTQLSSATFTGANLTGADLRSAAGASLTSATTHNTILPDGSIHGLTLAAGESLTVRNYTGGIPLHVSSEMTMDPAASLEIVLDEESFGPTIWGSTISFDPGIPVLLAGELDLTFAPQEGVQPGIILPGFMGYTFQLFDWNGVSPSGQFQVVSDYDWDLSQLYTTGDITLLGLAVPEPSTFVLLGVGAFGVLACAWRRRKRRTM